MTVTGYYERQQFILWINEAVTSGARRAVACREVSISLRTWRRWMNNPRDGRPEAIRAEPFNRLSPEEERRIRDICHQPEYASLPLSQIIPLLADNGIYWQVNPRFTGYCDAVVKYTGEDVRLVSKRPQPRQPVQRPDPVRSGHGTSPGYHLWCVVAGIICI